MGVGAGGGGRAWYKKWVVGCSRVGHGGEFRGHTRKMGLVGGYAKHRARKGAELLAFPGVGRSPRVPGVTECDGARSHQGAGAGPRVGIRA
jgi:hypothetical protein